MKTDTKTAIIETGAQIIHRKGFNHTGIQEVLSEAGIPKGSFYFYFKNKEDFGLQVIDYFIGYFDAMANEILNASPIPPLERLQIFFNTFNEFFKQQDCTLGCPIGNLAQEMGDLNPKFSEKLNNAIDKMADHYIAVLTEAQNDGSVDPKLNVRETAYFIISSWHGALVRMKVVKNLEPLEIWKRLIMERVLPAAKNQNLKISN